MEANEIHELQENQEHAAEGGSSMKRVSFTMSVLAVLLAMTSVLGHRTHTEAVLLQSRVSDAWNFYQSKKIRSTDAKFAGDILSAMGPAAAGAPKAAAAEYAYGQKESKDVDEKQNEARSLEAEVQVAERKAGWFDLGEALLQIGVIITSITLLTRRQVYWHLGTAFGVLGIVAASMAFIHPWVMHLFGHGS
jgi:hypothetical protein